MRINDPTLLHRFPAPKSSFFMMEDREEFGIPDGSAVEETPNNHQSGVSTGDAEVASSNKVNEDASTSGASADPIQEVNFEYQKFLKMMKTTNTPT